MLLQKGLVLTCLAVSVSYTYTTGRSFVEAFRASSIRGIYPRRTSVAASDVSRRAGETLNEVSADPATAAEGKTSGKKPMSREEFFNMADAFMKERGNSLEVRPKRLLFSNEGAAFVNMLARLEEVRMSGTESALGAVFGKCVAAVYKFVPSGDSALPNHFAGELDHELRAVQNALQPDVVLQASVGLDAATAEDNSGQAGQPSRKVDWRPLARDVVRASPRLLELLETFAPWDTIFPPELQRESGIGLDEFKLAAMAFARVAVREDPGTWTDAELAAAGRMVRSNFELRRVCSRAATVLASAGNMASVVTMVPAFVAIVLLSLFLFIAKGVFDSNSPSVSSPQTQVVPLYSLKS